MTSVPVPCASAQYWLPVLAICAGSLPGDQSGRVVGDTSILTQKLRGRVRCRSGGV